tara:strand:- start:661 stop:810 length:150 start_codon:yes stop_codon:yes gene_type:complete
VPGSVIQIIKNKGVVVNTNQDNILIKTVQIENNEPQNSSVIINKLDIIL